MARSLEKGQWAGVFSRTKQRIANNLGIIDGSEKDTLRKFRNDDLEKYDSYYENRQYDSLMNWDQAASTAGDYVAVRSRKPRLIYNLAHVLIDRVAAKLVGKSVYPTFSVEEDPDTTEFLRMVQKLSGMDYLLLDPVKRMLLNGSCLVRFFLVNGTLKLEWYNSKYCYPTVNESGELDFVKIQYVYEDPTEKDQSGNPKKKWYRLDLTPESDILYNNPDYEGGQAPDFQVVSQMDHGLGFVQAEWLRTTEDKHSPDGYSLIQDVLPLIDEINYNLSQSSQAVSYNQEPQLTITGMAEEEISELIKSSVKAWALGKEGEAKFLETDMKGIEAAGALRDRVKHKIADIVRVVMLDPEKIVGSAQSGKAMEVLHAPLLELIDELRPQLQKRMVNLLLKMAMATLQFSADGLETAIVIPPGYMPKSFDVSVMWPMIFPPTMEDLQKKAAIAVQLAAGTIISRESALRWLAKDIGIENIDEELQKLAAQPIINPFGSFGGP